MCPATYAITVAMMNTNPPIVGVPRLPLLDERLSSSRMGWPAFNRVSALMAKGVPNRDNTRATAAATITALTRAHCHGLGPNHEAGPRASTAVGRGRPTDRHVAQLHAVCRADKNLGVCVDPKFEYR